MRSVRSNPRPIRRPIRRPIGRRYVAAMLVALAATARGNDVTAVHGVIACADPAAADAAVRVMRDGGNAVDAAVEAALTLGVTMGYHSGIGGGCFMLIRTETGQTIALDGREMAPAAATPTMFIRDGKGDPTLSQDGPLATGVPGSLAVYDAATRRYGKKTLAELLRPAADLAEGGFVVTAPYGKAIDDVCATLARFPAAAALFMPGGRPLAAGDTLKQPDLARTYRNIADHGIAWFYRDGFPQQVEAWMKANDGVLTAADFASYRVADREPVVTDYRDYTIVGFPPPSSGGTHVAEILNVLRPFDVAGLNRKDPARRAHVMAEAMKLAFADRAFWLGDPDFAKVPKGLIDPGYGAALAKQIDLARAATDVAHGTPPDAERNLFGKHTTHISVADNRGNWVALTATVNTYFGSKVVVPGTGVILNDQMDDFSTQPGVPNAFGLVGAAANAPGPGKRPLSSMSPTIVLKNGRPILAVGAAGGPTIITQVVQVLSNVIDLGDDLPTAMAAPRLHHQWFPAKLRIDNTFPPAVLDELKRLGHDLDVRAPAGATNAVMRQPDGTFIGVSEPRNPAYKAAGY